MDKLENPPVIKMERGPYTISMYKNEDDTWIIRHHDEEVTTQGETVYEALFMLADALCGVNGDDLEELQETAEQVLDPDL